MLVPIDEVVHFDAITSSSTGAAADADSTPTFAVYEESTDTDIGVGGNLTKRTSLTGNYRGTFTASAANGFEAGKWYAVVVSATIGAVACKGVVMHFRCVPAETAAGVPKADVSHFGGSAGTFASGRPEVNATHWGGTAVASATVQANVAQIAGQAAVAAASVTFPATVGSSTLDAAAVRTAVGLASANLDTQLGDLPTAVENADALLGRNVAGGSSAGRTVSEALYALRNRVAISNGTMTVYQTNDITSAWTAPVTTSNTADPVIEINPT
jgi:hypothetical protein